MPSRYSRPGWRIIYDPRPDILGASYPTQGAGSDEIRSEFRYGSKGRVLSSTKVQRRLGGFGLDPGRRCPQIAPIFGNDRIGGPEIISEICEICG